MATININNVNKILTNKQDSRFGTLGTMSIGMLKGVSAIAAQKLKSNLKKDNIKKTLKNSFEIKNFNLTIPNGKTIVILGPSGCGKSTILRIIAGLMDIDSGTITYDKKDVKDINPAERKIGMVFQNYALYPHFKSKQNIMSYFIFNKKNKEMDKLAKEKYEKTSELMGVDIQYLLDKKPTNLSGGEQQRVAIGRCITREPKLFLLDEPFSNLDQLLREKYRINLKKLLNHFNITTVYVTHDQQEALIMADIIAVMKDGEIIQTGTYEEIYNNPLNKFVAEFLNIDSDTPGINFIDGKYINDDYSDRIIGFRPGEAEITDKKNKNTLTGIISYKRDIPIKNRSIINLKIDNYEIYITSEINNSFSDGDTVFFKLNKYFMFDKKSEKIIFN